MYIFYVSLNDITRMLIKKDKLRFVIFSSNFNVTILEMRSRHFKNMIETFDFFDE